MHDQKVYIGMVNMFNGKFGIVGSNGKVFYENQEFKDQDYCNMSVELFVHITNCCEADLLPGSLVVFSAIERRKEGKEGFIDCYF